MKKHFLLVALLCVIAITVFSQLMNVPKGNVPPDDPTSEWPRYTDTIEVKVGSDRSYGTAYVVNLVPKKERGDSVLPVVIGSCENRGIEDAKFGNDVGRPMTYDLFTTIMSRTGMKVHAVVVSKLQDGTFYADLLIEDNGKKLLFDARPSDAINLAMRANAKIFVAGKVWKAAAEPKL